MANASCWATPAESSTAGNVAPVAMPTASAGMIWSITQAAKRLPAGALTRFRVFCTGYLIPVSR
ncbi:hypothetical protein ACFFX0_27470 [Citricoccus parietis]|uniref:Uncharacterized protein n=1 Tax=Citricoccus parietis TaxID=592307 RepID=A0ABV5G6Z7_9MICC